MARNRGPAFVPPAPEPEPDADVEGQVVCCLGECRQVVELSTQVLSQQFRDELSQIAVILSRVLVPVQQVLLSQLQVAQDNVDRVTIDLEDAALHHLMETAWMVNQLQAGLPAPPGPLPGGAAALPTTTPAASGGVAGDATSAAQVAAGVATPQVAGPGAAVLRPVRGPGGALVAVPPPIGAELVPPPAGLYPEPVPPPVGTQLIQPPPPPLVQIVPGVLPEGSLACPPPPDYPVDWNQPLAFLFGHLNDSWKGQALAWMGAEMLAMAQLPNAAAVRQREVQRSARVDREDPPAVVEA